MAAVGSSAATPTEHGYHEGVFTLLPCLLVACNPSASFEIDGAIATMTGNIDHTTPDRVRALVGDHPEVRTIWMTDVPGSSDDLANAEAGRLVRAAGLQTTSLLRGPSPRAASISSVRVCNAPPPAVPASAL